MSFRLTASATALLLAAVPACHHALLHRERSRLTPNGKLIPVGGHALHIYTEGVRSPGAPALIFLSGGGTPDPAYNFRSLYRLLSPDYQIAVVEKPGYGYAPVTRAPRDVDTLLSETREALLKAGIAPAARIAVFHCGEGHRPLLGSLSTALCRGSGRNAPPRRLWPLPPQPDSRGAGGGVPCLPPVPLHTNRLLGVLL